MFSQSLLIIEDDLSISSMLMTYFTSLGYGVVHTIDSEQALLMASEIQPDLVIIDEIVDVTCYRLSNQLRETQSTRNIPILYLQNNEIQPDSMTSCDFRIDDYINKPIDIVELRLRVENIIRRAAIINSPVNPIRNEG